MASGDIIDYSIRPNKNIERKLIAECLNCLKQEFPIDKYKYIGLGGYWFVDFILFHMVLNIDDMISIEVEENAAKRAEYNVPFKCIEVIKGLTSDILPKLNLANSDNLIWLDYDSNLVDGPIIRDIEILCSESKVGNILIFTLNAHSNQLSSERGSDTDNENKRRNLKEIVGDIIPGDLDLELFSLNNFPKLLSKVLFDLCLRKTIISGREETFHPLFSFIYTDGAPMITIGGMIVDDEMIKKIKVCKLEKKYQFIKGQTPFLINVPPLTSKEKIAIDQLLPDDNPIDIEALKSIIGFDIKSKQIRDYEKFYKFYPVFAEMHP